MLEKEPETAQKGRHPALDAGSPLVIKIGDVGSKSDMTLAWNLHKQPVLSGVERIRLCPPNMVQADA